MGLFLVEQQILQFFVINNSKKVNKN